MGEAAVQLESVAAENRPARKILLVDDDVVQVDCLATRLQRQGFETIQAYSGKEGLTRARQQRPHVVLLDVRLPDLDGLEVCERLADDPLTCDIPIIVVSGMERPNIVRCTRAAGGKYFVRKPYDPNVLLALIEHALNSGGPF